MLIVLHVLSALASVVMATVLFFAPTRTRFNLSYGLVAGTVVSGSFLIIADHSHLLQSCLTGLLYIGGVSAALVLAQHRYAKQRS